MEPLEPERITVKDYFKDYDLNKLSYPRAVTIYKAIQPEGPLPTSGISEDGTPINTYLLLAILYTLTNTAINSLPTQAKELITTFYQDQNTVEAAMEASKIRSNGTFYTYCSRARAKFCDALNCLLQAHQIPLVIIPD